MKYIFFFSYLFIFATTTAQTPDKIKFQKNSSLIYFFQKGTSKDSVIKNSSDLFYLVIPDSLKKHVVVYVENGKLIKTANDSIVKLNYMQGLKYESQFVINELPVEANSKSLKKKFEMISLINGASSYSKNKILIQIINKKEEKVVVENIFFY
ncbi:MAG: hypothetical protein Q7W45_10245 [Bacteroidota bacterium]|nr:hypothetical protein [Bacteroidota bacterium]MDP3146292.1 hypothetical protein [Bacteroidota bacterium]